MSMGGNKAKNVETKGVKIMSVKLFHSQSREVCQEMREFIKFQSDFRLFFLVMNLGNDSKRFSPFGYQPHIRSLYKETE